MNKSRNTQYHKLVRKLISTERTELLKSVFDPLKPVEIANILLQLKLQDQLIVLENLEREMKPYENQDHLQPTSSFHGRIDHACSTTRRTIGTVCLLSHSSTVQNSHSLF